MLRQPGSTTWSCFLSLLCFSVFLVQCQRAPSKNGDTGLSSGEESNYFNTDNKSDKNPVTIDTGKELETMKSSIDKVSSADEDDPTKEDPEKVEGKEDAKSLISDLMKAYGELSPGQSLGQTERYYRAYLNAIGGSDDLVTALQRARLFSLVSYFQDLGNRRNVLQFVDATGTRHLLATDPTESTVLATQGWKFQGIIHRVFHRPKLGCTLPYGRYYNPATNSWVMFASQSPIPGYVFQALLGYICRKRQPYAVFQLYSVKNAAHDYLVTASRGYRDLLLALGTWFHDRTIFFAPN